MNTPAACALIEAMGMLSENLGRHHRGEAMAYPDTDFFGLIEKYKLQPEEKVDVSHVGFCMFS